MEKRFLLIAVVLVLFSVPLAFAISPTGDVIYGQSQGIVRSTTLPKENVHIEAQQQATIASEQRLAQVESALSSLQSSIQGQVNDLKVTAENQRNEFGQQLGSMNRELGAIHGSVDQLQSLQAQVRELRPALEEPREIIPPMSLMALSVANVILLIVVIVLIFWLSSQWKSITKEAHLEEHAQIHLTDFIREAMHKGASIAEVRRRLTQRGWSEEKIDEAIQEVRTMHAA